MRCNVPEHGISQLIFFLVATTLVGAFVLGTSHVGELWQSTELGRMRVPASLQARAIRTETFQPGPKSEVFARVQAVATYEVQGVPYTVTRDGAGEDAIPNRIWKRWDARQATGDLRVEVSMRRDHPSDAYIAPPGIEEGQLLSSIGLVIIVGVSGAVVIGLVSSVVHLVRGR